ncbi:hypothetical protein NDU88_010834 [Pleurodeles waltl]|uniref:Uncharacterized protein n=1 Tax=Pleurodeles waltl TaxID=8319 RepID=A0AAV7S309_PLEWA|nr:hypothetical protein NDU88_010834 [Pleurodeles waltl]
MERKSLGWCRVAYLPSWNRKQNTGAKTKGTIEPGPLVLDMRLDRRKKGTGRMEPGPPGLGMHLVRRKEATSKCFVEFP